MILHTVTVYSKSNCVQCRQTKTVLEKAGIPFNEINLENDPVALEHFTNRGFMAAPIVTFGEKTWSGFRHGELKNLIQHFESARAGQ